MYSNQSIIYGFNQKSNSSISKTISTKSKNTWLFMNLTLLIKLQNSITSFNTQSISSHQHNLSIKLSKILGKKFTNLKQKTFIYIVRTLINKSNIKTCTRK